MELTLYQRDLKEEYQGKINTFDVKFHHLNDKAQQAVRLAKWGLFIGHVDGVYVAEGKEGAIYDPEDSFVPK